MAANTSTRLQMIFDMYGVDIAKLNPSAPAENETGRNIPDIPVLDFSDGQPFVPDPTYGDFMPVDVERPDGSANHGQPDIPVLDFSDGQPFVPDPIYGDFMPVDVERPDGSANHGQPDIPVVDFSDDQPFVPDPTYGDFMPVNVERPDGAENTVGDYPAFIYDPVYGEFMLTNLERPQKDAYVDSILDSEAEQLPGADSVFSQPAATETGSSAIGANLLNTPYEDDTATIAAANAAIV
ncbi:hypothetical protein CRG49_009435 [Neisseria sp. N95_16]|uniref:Uncharacterized protein n=1 Tax=Neisseria brasiliensis TaxID=2666100 RepID=A0A5Q3S0M9_9NEIS|nr:MULTISPECIES: hypothetical protein [Neisseria]MRN38031.1 hypothetical protein [Neisseria brasiliensis]PJO09095.1 hypothetical protein CRG49_009435 [Neisseria sp. N95_16]PJO78017.1 hypothetical protein CWC45_07185 [Neisseria sp. N177_16]QGL24973.1 hypothetical protein GJV52_05185 [Neisseria brasiliensis]